LHVFETKKLSITKMSRPGFGKHVRVWNIVYGMDVIMRTVFKYFKSSYFVFCRWISTHFSATTAMDFHNFSATTAMDFHKFYATTEMHSSSIQIGGNPSQY
jgi:hypothetical protein